MIKVQQDLLTWKCMKSAFLISFDHYKINSLEEGRGNKNGKPISHRYDYLPLLPSGPGGVQ